MFNLVSSGLEHVEVRVRVRVSGLEYVEVRANVGVRFNLVSGGLMPCRHHRLNLNVLS